MIKAKIFVTTKEDVIDPQGQATQQALLKLGFDKVGQVRIGKTITIDLNTNDHTEAERIVKDMCDKLLVNKVVEQYHIQLSTESEGKADAKEGL